MKAIKKILDHPWFFWLTIGLICLIIIFIEKIYFHSKKPPSEKALPVVVDHVKTQNLPVYLQGLGAVISPDSVTVRTQINGQLLNVFFKEGQVVKAGDRLAQIDPRPYLALLQQYQGQLVRDQALLANAKLDLKRYEILWKQDSVAKQILDTQIALVKQDEGQVEIDQGLIESTKLNLIYCDIRSPTDGLIGLRYVDPGNYVQVSDANGLAVINKLNPMTVIFTITEDQLPDVLQQVSNSNTLIAEAYDRTQTKQLATGKLISIDNQIDPNTGTVKLRAQFDNPGFKLFPNQFVNVNLLVNTLLNVFVVPTAAIQRGVSGTFVYSIDQDSKAQVKPVTTGINAFGVTVVTGLQLNQRVVVEGADKLTDGSAVNITHDDSAKPTGGL